ncbi:MAG: glycosyltransferase family 9 protein [Candidatus Omnitrophota bacterium]
MKQPNNILIVRTDRLGDVILSTPVIKNLRLSFPKSHIAFLCRPYTRDALEGNPYLDEVITYDKYGRDKSFGASIRFSAYLGKKNFDLALILHPTNRVHLITFLARIPQRVGWDKKLSFLLTKKIPHSKQEGLKHELDYTLDILRALNIPIKCKDTYFPVSSNAEARVAEILKIKRVGENEEFIVIHPSASCRSKHWPQAHFLELIKLLRKEISLKIAVITSFAERELGKKLVEESGVIDLRGVLSVAELGALFKRTSLFISNDSGPVHIAASLDIPVISIFGRKDPGLSPLRWGPLGKEAFYFHKDAGCSKCLAHNCFKGFRCLIAISPYEVAKKAIDLLKADKK